MDRGFKISNVTRMLQYQSENALSPFVDTAKQMRIEATLEGDDFYSRNHPMCICYYGCRLDM